MKEVYRDREYTRVGYFQSVLEAEGIPSIVRNRDLVVMMTDVPIPDMFPALCVLNEEDFGQAQQIVKRLLTTENGEPAQVDEPVRGIFVLGILLIFGSLTLVLLSGWLKEIQLGKAFMPDSLAMIVLMLGSLWAVIYHCKRWFQRDLESERTS